MNAAKNTYVLAMLKHGGAVMKATSAKMLVRQETKNLAPVKALGKKPPAPVIRNVMK